MTRTNSRRTGGWLGVGAAVGALMAAGCAEVPPRPPPDSVPHTFKIILDGNGCPTEVHAEKGGCPGKSRACVVARNGDTVKFDAPKRIQVQFGPFRRTIFKPGVPLLVEVYVEEGLVDGKRFPFNVLPYELKDPSKACKGIDPEIIVRP